ncbi:sn-glycerol-3-phosphate ABC transporter ATP-binding protein UgpC [Marinovum sp.]|uniref:ABC transporter ATP-binding protein n=1 Tax=Marinovum sp. TaxID=2024839 RepID=UPI002B26C7B0|nr:sn-glycerol-3-phosphate ABC transporter ATP-binding protein UgpC [Marinovum sp.]
MAPVTFSNVQKSYGGHGVIHGVDIDIADGEFVVLVGPSGCGKSTLLRMLAGLETISGGEIAIGDTVVNDLEPKQRDIAMVFQNYALYPHMTVEENMGFSLHHRGASKPEIKQRVDWAAGILGLDTYLQRRPGQLSGGQRQRVAMGRAIVRDPKVFLFDEPLSNLDAKLRVVMRGEIKALHQKLKTTTIYVTHDQVEAMTMADKIVVLNGGKIEQIGTPLELYDNPVNQFVAAFIGSPSMNFIEGHVEGAQFVAGAAQLPAPTALPNGKPVVYGVRPEHFRLDPEGSIAAEVVVVEPMGSETQVTMQIAGQNVFGIFRERVSARPGEVLTLGVDQAHTHLFDAGSGLRLTAA